MRLSRRPAILILSLAVTLALSATVSSRTPEDTLLDQAGRGDQQARLELARLYTAQDQLQLAIEQLEAAATAGSPTAHELLAEQYGKMGGTENWTKALRHVAFFGTDGAA